MMSMPPSFRQRRPLSAGAVFLCGTACLIYMPTALAETAIPHTKRFKAHLAGKAAPLAVPKKKTAVQASQAESLQVQGRHFFAFAQAQRQPDSNTRISAQTLLERRVVSVTDLQNLAPNLTVQSLKGTQSINYHLRGVGMDDYYENNVSSVMVYLDGIAYPFSSMTDGMMFDIANVDIAPGPMGFTHGMPDTGGEVSLQSNDPTPDWHGNVTQDIASYARSRTSGFISGPLAKNLSFRVAAQTTQGGGWQYNPLNGAHLGDQNQTSLRAKLKWTPDDKTVIALGGHWTRDLSELVNGNPVINLAPAWQKYPKFSGYRQTAWGIQPGFAKLVGRPESLKPSEDNIFWGADFRISRELGFARLESISAFETERQGEYSDEDGTELATGDVYRNVNGDVFSQELKLVSTLPGKLHWTVGAYYNRSRMQQQFYNNFSDYQGRGYISESAYDQNQQAFSQYVNVNYDLTKIITVFGGLNHMSDDRQLLNFKTIKYGVNTLDFAPEGALTNQLGGLLGIQAQLTEHLQTYFKVSKGFKPGGFAANNTVAQAQLKAFKPESLVAYEVGFKSEPLPGKLRLNGAAFYYDYHNQQVVSSFLLNNYGPLGTYVNVPHSAIWGIELSAEAHPVSHIYINGNMGYERGSYTSFYALNTPAVNANRVATGVYKAFYTDYRGADLGIPKLTLSGGIAYRANLPYGLSTDLGVNGNYRDSQAMTIGGTGAYRLPPYFLMGTYATIGNKKQGWNATIYVTNLLDRHYSITSSSQSTTYQHVPGAPRFIGGRLSYGF